MDYDTIYGSGGEHPCSPAAKAARAANPNFGVDGMMISGPTTSTGTDQADSQDTLGGGSYLRLRHGWTHKKHHTCVDVPPLSTLEAAQISACGDFTGETECEESPDCRWINNSCEHKNKRAYKKKKYRLRGRSSETAKAHRG
eukprot:TRINITY_DN2704_c0_g1_i1.p2 TRINITY_DN2704_c0_g1~~TRINITY_DN2704_c0_g1_i1.p2  ORF type:complete len:142 (+),score=36.27 TRINITY_DN2704_c0_g1_i1:272-697(+)